MFIASDGHFVNDADEAYARKFIPLAMRKGVAVMFLDFTGSMGKGSYGAPVIDCRRKTPAQVATICGKAAIAEIRRLDAKGLASKPGAPRSLGIRPPRRGGVVSPFVPRTSAALPSTPQRRKTHDRRSRWKR